MRIEVMEMTVDMDESAEVFDVEHFEAPVFVSQTVEDCRRMTPAEKFERMSIAWIQAREAHRRFFYERYPHATPTDLWADWFRLSGCAAIYARGKKDEAERDADPAVVVDGSS